MSWDDKNARKVLLEKVIDREQIDGVVEPRHFPDAKYKRPADAKPDEPSYPTLRVGSKVIVKWNIYRDYRRSLAGYYLGVVIDVVQDSGSFVWGGRDAELIVQVTRVSNEPEMGFMVGRLRSVKMYRHDYYGCGNVVGFSPPLKTTDYHLEQKGKLG